MEVINNNGPTFFYIQFAIHWFEFGGSSCFGRFHSTALPKSKRRNCNPHHERHFNWIWCHFFCFGVHYIEGQDYFRRKGNNSFG